MIRVIALRHHDQVELVLPRGATGFLSDGVEPLSRDQRRAGLQLAHEAARAAGGSAGTVETKAVRSFESVEVRDLGHEQRQLWVLLHRIIPWITVVDRDPATTIPVAPHVIDLLLDPDVVSAAGWRLIRRSEALSSPSEAALEHLAQGERREIQHWKPASVGEVVFNHWD